MGVTNFGGNEPATTVGTSCQPLPYSTCLEESGDQGCASREEGEGEGDWDPKFCVDKWLDQIFPVVNFVFSHYGHFGLKEGGGGPWGWV